VDGEFPAESAEDVDAMMENAIASCRKDDLLLNQDDPTKGT
jgi:hypothetical protein